MRLLAHFCLLLNWHLFGSFFLEGALMGKIVLARHGQDADNARGILNGRRNSPLTTEGIVQAYSLADKLRNDGSLNIKHVFSSRLQRAFETADICARTLGVSHTALDYLVERSHGILEGHPYSDIPILAKSYKEAYGFTYVVEVEGGENYAELCERARIILVKIKKEISNIGIWGDVLIVSHGAISRAIQTVSAGLTHEDIFNQPSFSNCEYRILE